MNMEVEVFSAVVSLLTCWAVSVRQGNKFYDWLLQLVGVLFEWLKMCGTTNLQLTVHSWTMEGDSPGFAVYRGHLWNLTATSHDIRPQRSRWHHQVVNDICPLPLFNKAISFQHSQKIFTKYIQRATYIRHLQHIHCTVWSHEECLPVTHQSN